MMPAGGRGEGVRLMDWAHILAYVTGMVDQEVLAGNEYLAAENRVLKAQLKGRLQLSDTDRDTGRDQASPAPRGSRRGGHCSAVGLN